MEHDDLVDAVQELGPEGPLQLLLEASLDLLILAHFSRSAEAERVAPLLVGAGRAYVRGHDDDRIAEVHRPTMSVGQTAVVEDLQQRIEDFRMRLFDLVEQDDLVWPTPYGFGELSALIEADIAWRRTEQTAHRVRLHVLGHVQPQQGIFVVEQVVGQGLGQLGLAHASWAEEQKRANWPLRIA